MGQKLRELPPGAEISAVVDMEDVDGAVCAALVLKRFPRARIKPSSAKGVKVEGKLVAPAVEELEGRFDLVADLSLPKSIEARVWVDHHLTAVQEGKCLERVYDSRAPSAAGLLAKYLGVEAPELVEVADRADSVSYLTEPPLDFEPGYDPAWDVNDAVKALDSSKRFIELARVLAEKGIAGLREEFTPEISHTRELRRRAEALVKGVEKELRERGADAVLLLMPRVERRGSTVSAHLVFSLYRRGLIKAAAVFYEGGCWINVGRGFEGLNAGSLAQELGGGGHRFSAGAPVGLESLGKIKSKFKQAGLTPAVIDLRKVK